MTLVKVYENEHKELKELCLEFKTKYKKPFTHSDVIRVLLDNFRGSKYGKKKEIIETVKEC